MEGDLFCNVKSCRKRLTTGTAWATSCSHIFCNEDGQKIIYRHHYCAKSCICAGKKTTESLSLRNILNMAKRICPACSKDISAKLDIVRIDTNPSEAYRSMVLIGQRPEVILDVCSRAVSSWSYQVHQEQMYKDYLHNRANEKYSNLKRYCDQMSASWELEAKAMKSQLASAKSEIESTKKLNAELAEKLREKTRQYQKLLTMYNSLRRNSLHPQPDSMCSSAMGDVRNRNEDFLSAFDVPVGGSTNPSRTSSPFDNKVHHRSSSSTPTFSFKFSHPSTPFIQRETSGLQDNTTIQQRMFSWNRDK